MLVTVTSGVLGSAVSPAESGSLWRSFSTIHHIQISEQDETLPFRYPSFHLSLEFSWGLPPSSPFPGDTGNPVSIWGHQPREWQWILTICLRQGSHTDHSLQELILQSIGSGVSFACSVSGVKLRQQNASTSWRDMCLFPRSLHKPV